MDAMNNVSRYPWALIAGTLIIALGLYVLSGVFVVGHMAQTAREARAQQQSRLDRAALRIEGYLGRGITASNVAAATLGADANRSEIERDLHRLMGAADPRLLYGIGVFYAPHAFDARKTRFGEYLYAGDGEQHKLIVVDDRSAYDYFTRPWYAAAVQSPGRTVWSGPYVSRHGYAFIGASKSFDAGHAIAGVVLVEARQRVLNSILEDEASSNDRLWITDSSRRTILKNSANDNLRADGTAQLPLGSASWTVHVASRFPQVAAARGRMLAIGIPATAAYWVLVMLIVAAVIRMRRLQLQNASLEETASRDVSTGVRNRRYMLRRLESALAQNAPAGTQFGVLFLDIDRFATVNDSLGHAAGDEMLRAVSRHIERGLPGNAELARIGGDEFAVFVAPPTNASECASIAHSIIQQLSTMLEVGSRHLYVGVSIGIVLSSPVYSSANELLRDADTAMYAAKRAGRGRYAVFDDRMRADALMRLSMENALRRAIELETITAHYQPIVSLRTGEVVSLEALARWTSEDGEQVQPSIFIPLAEQCGVIEAIDDMVLMQACRSAKRLQERWPQLSMSVNVSMSSVHDGRLVDKIRTAIEASLIRPELVKVELTETVVMTDPEDALEQLRRLLLLGVAAVIDDFGMGYSSLSYVQRLPVAGLKIDRSFVENVHCDEHSLAIVRAIAALASTLSLYVVAEGVETAEQVKALQDIGVDYAQGYYYAAALDAAQVEAYIELREASRAQSA